MMYGGHPNTWMKDHKVTDTKHLPSIMEFYNDSIVIKTQYANDFPKFTDILTYYGGFRKVPCQN